jgi:hypothetical protein
MGQSLPSLRLSRGGPDAIARARSATLYCEVGDPTTGLPAEITAAGSSFELRDASGAVVVTGGTVTSPTKGRLEYALASATVPATLPYGLGYREFWTVQIGSSTYILEREAALCRAVPVGQVVAEDLFVHAPELADAVPTRQIAVGWQPQIAEAERELHQRLADDERRPWLIWSGGSTRMWQLYRALALCFRVNATRLTDSRWTSEADRYDGLAKGEWERLRFDYDFNDDAVRDAKVAARPTIIFGAGPRWGARGRSVVS